MAKGHPITHGAEKPTRRFSAFPKSAISAVRERGLELLRMQSTGTEIPDKGSDLNSVRAFFITREVRFPSAHDELRSLPTVASFVLERVATPESAFLPFSNGDQIALGTPGAQSGTA